MEIVLVRILFLSLKTIWNYLLIDGDFCIVGVLYLHWLRYLLLLQVSMWAGTHIFILELQSGNSRKLSMWYDGTVCFIELWLLLWLTFTSSDHFGHIWYVFLDLCSMLSVLMIIHPSIFRCATTVTWGFSLVGSSSIRSLLQLLLSFVICQHSNCMISLITLLSFFRIFE